MITEEMIGWANDFLLRLAEKYRPVATGYADYSLPSQSDKPSPKSSLTASQVRRKFKLGFPEKYGYEVHRIANTNSMEPLLDDSDVVVLELLTDEYRGTRLKRECFAAGQIVIYNCSAGSIIHTLKSKTSFLGKDAWIIQGHNNFLPDMAKITESNIVARVVAIGYGRRVREGD